MAGFVRSREEERFLRDSVAAAKRSVDISLIQYREGLVDFQRVLDAQQNLVRQQDNWVATTGNVGLSLVALYKALGGGWETRDGQPWIDPETLQTMQERTDWGELIPAGDDDRRD